MISLDSSPPLRIAIALLIIRNKSPLCGLTAYVRLLKRLISGNGITARSEKTESPPFKLCDGKAPASSLSPDSWSAQFMCFTSLVSQHKFEQLCGQVLDGLRYSETPLISSEWRQAPPHSCTCVFLQHQSSGNPNRHASLGMTTVQTNNDIFDALISTTAAPCCLYSSTLTQQYSSEITTDTSVRIHTDLILLTYSFRRLIRVFNLYDSDSDSGLFHTALNDNQFRRLYRATMDTLPCLIQAMDAAQVLQRGTKDQYSISAKSHIVSIFRSALEMVIMASYAQYSGVCATIKLRSRHLVVFKSLRNLLTAILLSPDGSSVAHRAILESYACQLIQVAGMLLGLQLVGGYWMDNTSVDDDKDESQTLATWLMSAMTLAYQKLHWTNLPHNQSHNKPKAEHLHNLSSQTRLQMQSILLNAMFDQTMLANDDVPITTSNWEPKAYSRSFLKADFRSHVWKLIGWDSLTEEIHAWESEMQNELDQGD